MKQRKWQRQSWPSRTLVHVEQETSSEPGKYRLGEMSEGTDSKGPGLRLGPFAFSAKVAKNGYDSSENLDLICVIHKRLERGV